MPEGLTAMLVQPTVGGCEHVALGLDGAGTEQRDPVGLAGQAREGRRYRQE